MGVPGMKYIITRKDYGPSSDESRSRVAIIQYSSNRGATVHVSASASILLTALQLHISKGTDLPAFGTNKSLRYTMWRYSIRTFSYTTTAQQRPVLFTVLHTIPTSEQIEDMVCLSPLLFKQDTQARSFCACANALLKHARFPFSRSRKIVNRLRGL